MSYGYVATYDAKTQARAVGEALPISNKRSIEVCARIRGKPLGKAKAYLQRVIVQDEAVLFSRFNRGGVGQRPGMFTGRYPIKTCKYILKVIEQAQANAESKGLSAETLAVLHIAAQKGGKAFRYGRGRRRMQKRTSIEVLLGEAPKKEEKKARKASKKETAQ